MATTNKETDIKPGTDYQFTPVHPFKMDDPKSWASTIGMMNWDQDKIVFSKRSLLEFLKSCQMTVGTNFTEIQKLPKYATFGHFSKDLTDEAVNDLVDAEIGDPTTDKDVPRPSRKVVDPPGGKQNLHLYGEEYAEEDALSLAPPPPGQSGFDVEVDRMQHLKLHVEEDKEDKDGGAHIDPVTSDTTDGERVSNPPPGFRPTRKVRQGPGGTSQLGSSFFGGYDEETDADREAAKASTGGKRTGDKQAGSGLW